MDFIHPTRMFSCSINFQEMRISRSQVYRFTLIGFVRHLDITLESLIKLSYMCTKGDRDVIDSFYILLRIDICI